ncbi:MAG TPA: helix-turn-helix domain-containing protein [Ensifer sp.]|jgi:AraC-like DNA-binding protein|uniref:helix-turn-helix domain-containing protein n=1 Tax=Ensifer sp. TaxID=1872086 RepID=UPI002E167B82|nr:helix-turn-helix domain-containing protein [Ensifer sp.]
MTVANGVGACFGEPDASVLVTHPVRDARFSVTRLRCRLDGELGRLVRLPADDSYFLMLYFKDVMHCDVTDDGCDGDIQRYRQGSICLVDLAHGANVRLVSDLDALGFHLPRRLFREVSEFALAPSLTGLRCLRGEIDDVMLNLAQALLPLFGEDDNGPGPVLPHIAIAICAHLLHSYPERAGASDAGLSIWQEKAVKDFMIDHWTEDFSLAETAAATHLTEDDLAAGFVSVTGQAPEQWLLRYRIGRAKHYLTGGGEPLATIAARCGFADEAHFTEAFRTVTGVSPSAWRARWLQ